MQKYTLLIAKALLTLAFAAAGFFKLTGHEMMVGTFDAIGVGQWFRYLTGVIELGAAALLWLPGKQFIAAALLVCTMIGATLAHLLILGPSALPAIVLGVIAAYVAYSHRAQNPIAA
ncbi:MAG: DoxX family protein [Shimia sp.]|nr:DoxX family protein [Shimia sp.]